jgi:hypothetical protein
MASNSAKDTRKSEKADETNGTQTDRNAADIFQDASDSPDRASPSATREQHDDSNYDAEAETEADDPNETHMTESGYDAEEPHMEYGHEREGRSAGFRQGNPPPLFNTNVLPEQQDIQERHLADLLDDLPPDLANDPDEYRQQLVRRGITEDLIKQQEEHLARFNAHRLPTAESEWETFPAVGGTGDNNAASWNATLPNRSAQKDRDPTTADTRDAHAGHWQQEGEGQEPAENQRGAPDQPAPVFFYASVRIPISTLVVVAETGEVLHHYSQSELRIATIDTATHCLRVETRRPHNW